MNTATTPIAAITSATTPTRKPHPQYHNHNHYTTTTKPQGKTTTCNHIQTTPRMTSTRGSMGNSKPHPLLVDPQDCILAATWEAAGLQSPNQNPWSTVYLEYRIPNIPSRQRHTHRQLSISWLE